MLDIFNFLRDSFIEVKMGFFSLVVYILFLYVLKFGQVVYFKIESSTYFNSYIKGMI